jgi:hypothetical protein
MSVAPETLKPLGAGSTKGLVTLASRPSADDLRGCRFIAGEPLPIRAGMWCCAQLKPDSSFCPEHHAVVWGGRAYDEAAD